MRVPADFTLPVLAGVVPGFVEMVAGESSTMVAAYVDTPDLRLARWGVTLRRREGGTDEGWHLKLPQPGQGSLVREEIALPLAAGEVGRVPAALEDLVRALVREAPLVHVVTVRTHRTPYALLDAVGARVAEVVDDRVEIVEGVDVVRRFREIEVEAGRDGDPDVASSVGAAAAVLLAHGGTPESRSKAAAALGAAADGPPDVVVPPWPSAREPASAAIRCILAANVRAFLLADVAVRRDLPDSVHQLRVAARTLRSALRTFGPLLDARWSAALREELRWAADTLAVIRDTEVRIVRLEESAAILPPDDRDRAVRVVDRSLRGHLQDARVVALDEMRGARYVRLLSTLVDAAREPRLSIAASDPAKVAFEPLVAAAVRRLVRSVGRLTKDSPEQKWHRARILAKRVRYASEVLTPVLGRRARTWGENLARVTDVLGEVHDSTAAQQVVHELAGRPEVDGLTGYALGLLHEVEAERERRDKRAFARLWPGVRKTLARGALR